MLNALLVAAALVSQVPVEADEAPPSWEVFVGLEGGLRTDNLGGGGTGHLGVNRRIFSWLRPELSVGLGFFATPLDAVIKIKIGSRLEWPSDSWIKPYLFLAFAHFHELGWEDARRDPVTGILGLSDSHTDHGVHHRSGLDSGVGLSLELRHFLGTRFGGKLNLRASMTNLLGEGPSRYVDLLTTFGVIF